MNAFIAMPLIFNKIFIHLYRTHVKVLWNKQESNGWMPLNYLPYFWCCGDMPCSIYYQVTVGTSQSIASYTHFICRSL